MTEEDFFKNVIIKDNEKLSANVFLKSKGIVKHSLIKEYLLLRSNIAQIEYSLIASTYRYDKRLRTILFKYISYLEEYYRGMILDGYYNNTKQSFWVRSLAYYLEYFKNDLDKALEKIQFGELISQLKKTPDLKTIVGFSDKNKRRLGKNLAALIGLRNAVMHNKLLVLFKDYGECQTNTGIKSSTLASNIRNLINFLPNGPREKCVEELNKCSNNNNNEKDVRWNLPSYIIVKI